MSVELSPNDIERYSRQLILQGWSQQLQLRLGEISVAIPMRMSVLQRYLTAAGIKNVYRTPIGGTDTAQETAQETAPKTAPVTAPKTETVDYRVVDRTVMDRSIVERSIVERPIVEHAAESPSSSLSPTAAEAGTRELTILVDAGTLTIQHQNHSQSFDISDSGALLECWIATLIISHLRNAPKGIFPVAAMLFA